MLDGLEFFATSKSIRRTKRKSIRLIAFHSSIKILSLHITERPPMYCHLTDHSTMPLISKPERSPLGDLSMLFQTRSYQYSTITSKKCFTRDTSTQVSRQQVHLFSWFQSLMAEAYIGALTIQDSTRSPSRIEDHYCWWTNSVIRYGVIGSSPRSTSRLDSTSFKSKKETSGRQHFVRDMAYMHRLPCPSGLANALVTCQDAMETIFTVMLDRGLLIPNDHFLIYSETEE